MGGHYEKDIMRQLQEVMARLDKTEQEVKDTKKAWKILAMLGILMILFYIWRMLRYFPGNPPMSYYYGNVLLNLHHIIKSFLQI